MVEHVRVSMQLQGYWDTRVYCSRYNTNRVWVFIQVRKKIFVARHTAEHESIVTQKKHDLMTGMMKHRE